MLSSMAARTGYTSITLALWRNTAVVVNNRHMLRAGMVTLRSRRGQQRWTGDITLPLWSTTRIFFTDGMVTLTCFVVNNRHMP